MKQTVDAVAKKLELLEETVIYRFLDRVQLAFHPGLYPKPGSKLANTANTGEQSSLLGLRLRAHEAMEQEFGRYSVAEEFPFSAAHSVPQAKNEKPLAASQAIWEKLAPQEQRTPVAAELPLSLARIREISQCQGILEAYLDFLPRYCAQTDDMQYGSALEYDVMLLQAISRRIHYGAIYVAELKFQQNEVTLRKLFAGPTDELEQKILALITRAEVEQKILKRVYGKTQAIQYAGPDFGLQRHHLEPQALRNFYADCIIPLTKQGELAYLRRRV